MSSWGHVPGKACSFFNGLPIESEHSLCLFIQMCLSLCDVCSFPRVCWLDIFGRVCVFEGGGPEILLGLP